MTDWRGMMAARDAASRTTIDRAIELRRDYSALIQRLDAIDARLTDPVADEQDAEAYADGSVDYWLTKRDAAAGRAIFAAGEMGIELPADIYHI